jgi:hypothetical protein
MIEIHTTNHTKYNQDFFEKKTTTRKQTKNRATQINFIQRLWVPLKHPNLVTNQRMLLLATGLVVLKVKRGKRKRKKTESSRGAPLVDGSRGFC